MSPAKREELEWKTRKKRIDPRLDACGWLRAARPPLPRPFRTEEEETGHGPADYALWLENRIVGVIEAKKLTVGPQNVLTQAERYARAIRNPKFNFDGFGCPFLYATNGEVIWFHDVRHPLNRSRTISRFHTPSALKEMLTRDYDNAVAKLGELTPGPPWMRPYHFEVSKALHQALVDRKRKMLVAMATGTGKTNTVVNQAYRLMKSGVAKRVLFLVDRRALAAQTVRSFSSFEVEPGQKFDQVYEVYSSKFQQEDFGEDERFDPKVLPQEYLTNPQPGHAFVYVATIQRMAINLFGRQAVFSDADTEVDDDADRLDIPIHAFDAIIADECHRGYTAQEVSTWRNTLDHFDAIKIGLTATPASHTTAYFTHKVFDYPYEQAVRDGFLVDYDVVRVRSDVRMNGLFLREGENVERVDPTTGTTTMDTLEDEREVPTTELESRITAPESNKKIVEELKKHCDDHERKYGRFPKTLIFAVNDMPHTGHADQLVDVARDVFGKGDAFVQKITGRIDRPLQKIREFRNRPNPGIAVTVDLLTTGVDIPDLEFLVFLRPLKSRILFVQMLGRGTRKGDKVPSKDHFTVFDCFDGTLLKYFKDATDMTTEEPAKPTRTIPEIVADIWDNKERDYNVNVLVKRLQRIDKSMSGKAREAFSAYVPDGDVARFARSLPAAMRNEFGQTMTMLRNKDFQDLLVNYPRPERTFLRAYEQTDNVSSILVFRDIAGAEYKPEDYLAVFNRFVKENEAHIEAIRVLLDRPREWNANALSELRKKLAGSRYNFTTEKLQKAHELRYRKPLVDVISMVKHAAKEEEPLFTAAERVERAFAKVTTGQTFSDEQQRWLDRIRQVMLANLSIDREDFEYQDALSGPGGWGAAKRHFGETPLADLIRNLNEAIAA